jgi:hypothetical protein
MTTSPNSSSSIPSSSIHATALLCGARGVLIRGPSGSGKSQLALSLLQRLPFARLVGDDRILLQATHGRVLMRPAATLHGLLEIRGLGIRKVPFEAVAVAHLVVDLAVAGAERLPAAQAMTTTMEGVALARLPVAPEACALTLLLGFLQQGQARAGLPAA